MADEEAVEEVVETSQVPDPPTPYARHVAEEVVAGHWGRGNRRKQRLRDAGYDPDAVLQEVHNILHR